MLRATRQIFDKAISSGANANSKGSANTVPAQTPTLPPQNKWIRRGNVLMSRGDMIGAISEFSQALLANQRDVDAYVGRGKAFQATGGYELARRDFNVALAVDSKSSPAYTARGALNYALSKLREEDQEMLLHAALDDLNKAVALDPNCAEAYKYRSIVYAALDGNVLETSRGSRAVYDAYLSLKLNPNFSPAKG
jgi:tetratricopeptide (TPR) repeat protein